MTELIRQADEMGMPEGFSGPRPEEGPPEPPVAVDDGDMDEAWVTLSDFDDPNEKPISFEMLLDAVPGAKDAIEITDEEPEGDIEVKDEDEEVEVEEDPWDWKGRGLGKFLHWLSDMMQNVPQHTGFDTTGLEKAIAYFEALDREITRAMRMDFKNEIDSAQAEKAREQIEKGLDRLVERLERVRPQKFRRHQKKQQAKKNSWMVASGLVKEAQKATRIGGITITVPLLISRIARVCINGMVSAGHDIEDLYERQVKAYGLDKREQAEVMQLLADMGYPLRQDRGLMPGEEFDTTRSDNFDMAANYNS